MKNPIILFLLFFFSFFLNHLYALDITASWSFETETNWMSYAWKVVFPNSLYWVKIKTDEFDLDDKKDMQVSWNFWLSNLSSASDLTLWWVSFDIGNVPWAPKVILKNNLDNTFTFSWYSWSKAAWWIYFSPVLLKDSWGNEIPNSKVIYDRWLWEFKWCAWNNNIWWICFNWIKLDTTPPKIVWQSNLSMISSADHNKIINLNEESFIEIENWDSTAKTIYNNKTTFEHDMRRAKSSNYYIKATDLSWNFATWSIQIVANIPFEFDEYHKISPDATRLSYWWTLTTEKIADWKDAHTIDIKLRDTYWNPIIPVAWVKDVDVTLSFANNLDNIQVWTEYNLWDAIKFSNSNFLSLFWWIWSTSSTDSTIDWNYKVDITSLAPSKAWYNYVNINNDIQVDDLTIKITPFDLYSLVWQGVFNAKSKYNNPIKFTPVVKIIEVINNDFWVITRGYETFFTLKWSIDKSIYSFLLNELKISHIFDVMSWTSYKNTQMSFQNLTWSGWSTYCVWYNTGNWYYNNNSLCNNITQLSSNIIRNYSDSSSSNLTFQDTLWITPKIVTAWLPNFVTKYSSIISYKINWNDVKYNSITQDSSIINNTQIKVAWIVNKNNNNFSVVSDSDINFIWNMSKSNLYSIIHKNVAKFQKAWVWSAWTKYIKWDYTLSSWPAWVNTIIVDGWDIIIEKNIPKVSWEPKIIIAIKKSDWTKWNIWIKSNVEFVWAVLIADKSILSWDWTNYYSDNNSATNQLFIKWSMISYNTIWWSSKTPFACPYYIKAWDCSFETSKRYDYNNFRSYIKSVRWTPFDWVEYWINMSVSWYENAPMIIEYDSDIQKTPPAIIK